MFSVDPRNTLHYRAKWTRAHSLIITQVTRSAMYVQLNTKARSLNPLLPWKTNKHYIFLCVCVCVRVRVRTCARTRADLLVHHATRMRRIIL